MADANHTLPVDLFIDLDRSGPMPLYFQISSRIEAAIQDGRLPPGSRLENEVALGNRLGLSRPTIRRAIQELVDKGLLVRRRGIGTQVVHGKVSRSVELTSLYEDLERSGQKPETRVLSMEVGEADDRMAEELGVDAGSPVLHIKRLRSAGSVPIAILDNVLPADFTDIDLGDLTKHGLYQLLRARGVTMRVAKQRIGAREATAQEAGLLDIPKGAAVLTMSRTAFDNSGRAVEWGQHCYRPDLYSFEMTLVER
ncbi:GntR family transcriptional regulator [Agromyces albus]|jgi:DNA-binding GntR family transcriptional regulator|uniref:GntR family transcriptional regulator n=1 Tax=Agromyces albus TaxID=205332 RepID=UPI00278598BB|nr:GntR family transcriptional regulator [Agromyces albus]MDQ0575870.1 DNA-binding GntR family transcriptional regulator [Agromyces albus]